MDVLVKTMLFGNSFQTVANPARLVPIKFEIYQSDQGFYHRIYKEVGMSGANLGQVFRVWAFEEQTSWDKQTKNTTLDEYVSYCKSLYTQAEQ
ncbi:hypothetical protein [Providencia rettgeri]|uniref:hypothetical protein n=1 Tax=Providencia rettgeri TaxID=587 RepID=UPI0034E09D11